MADEPTCGEGLAHHSTLPLGLADLVDRLAETLEVHTRALDPSDEAAEREREVYLELAGRHRRIAAELRAAGEAMAGQRDLPMARHDEAVLASPELAVPFAGFVEAEQAVLELLAREVEQHRAMLGG